MPKGHILAHASGLMHAGHPISAGIRYILVAFVTIDAAYGTWSKSFYEHACAIDDGLDREASG